MFYYGFDQLKVRRPTDIEGFLMALHVCQIRIDAGFDLLWGKMLKICKLVEGVPTPLRFVDITSEEFCGFPDLLDDFFTRLPLGTSRQNSLGEWPGCKNRNPE